MNDETVTPEFEPSDVSQGAHVLSGEEWDRLQARLTQLEQFQHMVELNPQAPWVTNAAGQLLDFGPRWLELTGLTREQALTTGWTDVPHPDDLPRMLAGLSHAMATGVPLDMEHRIRVANGSYRWMRTRAYPRRNEQGEIVNWHGFTEDVDARVRAEQALQASEIRYRTIVEAVHEGIWMVDGDYCTTFANGRMAAMLGYTCEEMAGRPISDFMDDTAFEDFTRHRELRQAGSHEQYDGRYRRKDGTDLWLIVSADPLMDEDGQFCGAIAFMTDISDRKQLEREHSRLAAIVQFSEDGIVSKDLHGIVTSWNLAAERIFGWHADEIIGRSKSLIIPQDLKDELPAILRRVSAGDPILPYETRRVRKDGTEIDVSISVSPVKDADGNITGAATIVRDITERKRTERELQRKQAEVESLNERLKRAMRETHHRVKNNLQIISAMIDMQSIEHRGSSTVPIKELSRLNGHIRTLATVHDLLTRDIREDERDQRVSSKSVIEMLLSLLAQSPAPLTVESQIEDIALHSKQAVTLSLIINELVSNAAKHAPGRVLVTLSADQGLAHLQVQDEGPGFSEGFDPVANSHLGLELVQGIVATDLMGQCCFETRAEGGAVVSIRFPIPDDAPEGDLTA